MSRKIEKDGGLDKTENSIAFWFSSLNYGKKGIRQGFTLYEIYRIY